MQTTDRQFLALKRLQILTGVLPVGAFLASHLAINGIAIAGRAAYGRAIAALDRLPWLGLVEALAIALPLLVHLALAVALGLTRQAAFEPAYPNERARMVQRVTGFYLAMYVVFHVWALRFSPERHAGKVELFDQVAAQLDTPAGLALHAVAVITAALHFTFGCLALSGPRAFPLAPGGRRMVRVASVAGGLLLAVLGLNALLAFIWEPARWLAPR